MADWKFAHAVALRAPRSPRRVQVVAKYLSNAEASGGLPFETHRLLVPHLSDGMAPDDLPPHMKNGARDYIVVPNHLLSLGDTECSKIGAYFRAFSNQDERCQRQIGSCLEMQPLDMWSQDDVSELLISSVLFTIYHVRLSVHSNDT
ncbi:hypothetical protein HPB50_027047 [Hyalomma asiaticum]|uniref:Uncharacterized protein n=1 Tax=Hyalomma asiaticum TaxID=266040 RepID=A0ACB7RQM5_HYAAI|nr:hypothetical protein HPB50_027047 [Hyalomma asiaticum]